MRILLINWAKIWDGASHGGGVNGYCQSLALEFVALGHEVCYLGGGTTYTPAPAEPVSPGPIEVRRHPDWLGVRVFEILNSPVLAPAAYQFKDPGPEASAPDLERVFAEFVAMLAPDVVHLHNIEGLSAGCVRAIKSHAPSGDRVSPAVLWSLHNYHPVCPQAYFIRQYTTLCRDYDAGRACVTCLDGPDPSMERRRRAMADPAGEGAPVRAPDEPPEFPLTAALGEVRRWWRGLSATGPATETKENGPNTPPAHPPGSPARTPRDLTIPLPVLGADQRGQTAQVIAERSGPAARPDPNDPALEPRDNAIRAQTEDPRVETAYARRRRAMIGALNACDRVIAVSAFVREKFASLGVDAERLVTQPIGTKAGRIRALAPDLVFDPPPFESPNPRPVRLVFLGYNNVYKGLPMLADALDALAPDSARRFHIFIYAQAGETIEWRFRRIEPKLGGLTVHHGYRATDIPWILGGKDLGIVPSVWWDNAPQTVFEFFSCGVPVLAANLGGIPDFVRDGHNGRLFRGNDRADLTRTLGEIAADPSSMFEWRRNVRPPKDIGDHARELENLYAGCVSLSDAGRAAAVRADSAPPNVGA